MNSFLLIKRQPIQYQKNFKDYVSSLTFYRKNRIKHLPIFKCGVML